LDQVKGEIDAIRRSTLASPVRRHIEREIFAGRLKVGEKVNEVALAGALGVSRGPVREALNQLEEAGWIVSVPQRGSFVRVVSLDEAMDAYAVRIALAGPVAKGVAIHADDRAKAELATLPDQMRSANKSGDIEGINALSQRFVDLLAGCCGNETLGRIFASLHLTHRLFRLSVLNELGQLADLLIPMNRVAVEQRAEVIGAILKGAPDDAAALYVAYVEASRDRSRARHLEAVGRHAREAS
jgi:DNA-binding GntR family transcriptional regulator